MSFQKLSIETIIKCTVVLAFQVPSAHIVPDGSDSVCYVTGMQKCLRLCDLLLSNHFVFVTDLIGMYGVCLNPFTPTQFLNLCFYSCVNQEAYIIRSEKLFSTQIPGQCTT